MMTRAELLGFLAAHDIEQSTLDHPPVFTVSEGAEIKARLSGAHTKNLFLKDKKGALWLVSARDHASVDLKALPALVGCARLSFGDEATLALALGVTPGSVTALALVMMLALGVATLGTARVLARLRHGYPPIWRKSQNKDPASMMDAGSVRTQAMARLRTVPHCSPEWLAAMVPATPEDSTCVVLTGMPNQSAAPMVNMAVISAAAPCA